MSASGRILSLTKIRECLTFFLHRSGLDPAAYNIAIGFVCGSRVLEAFVSGYVAWQLKSETTSVLLCLRVAQNYVAGVIQPASTHLRGKLGG